MKYKRLLDVSTVIFPLEALLFPPSDNTLRHRSFSRHFRQGEVVVFEVEGVVEEVLEGEVVKWVVMMAGMVEVVGEVEVVELVIGVVH